MGNVQRECVGRLDALLGEMGRKSQGKKTVRIGKANRNCNRETPTEGNLGVVQVVPKWLNNQPLMLMANQTKIINTHKLIKMFQ